MIIDVMDLNFNGINFNKNYDYTRYNKARKLYNYSCVDINFVDKQKEEDKDKYIIEADVNGNYDRYHVTLELLGQNLKKSKCTCADYEKGNFCKHILATCMEVIDPHEPSTPQRIEEIRIAELKRLKEQRKAYEQKLLEEKKKREYQQKYSNSLNVLRRYMEYDNEGIFRGKNPNYDLKTLYNDTKRVILLDTESNSNENLATNISIQPRIIINYRKYRSSI